MKEYREEDYLMLSGIQHYNFCKRQWAFIHVEQQWEENIRTIEGKILHEKAHNNAIMEKRGDVITSRGMPIFSKTMGIAGECDVVEFHKSSEGISIYGYDDKYIVIPVEYKKGAPKENDVDILQLAAQAMCLEEMLCCQIKHGYLYYGETRHRVKIAFTDELRNEVKTSFDEMHRLFDRRHTPMVKRSKACNACSIKNLCLPILLKNKNVDQYLDKLINEEDDS